MNLKVKYFFLGVVSIVLLGLAGYSLISYSMKSKMDKIYGDKNSINQRAKIMESKISIITLAVNDLEKSVQFYKNGLGFNLNEQQSSAFIAFFQLNGIQLALFPSEALAKDAGIAHERGQFSGITLAHNVGSPEEVDQLLDLAKASGATITKNGEKKSWGGYSGYFQDLDGHLWEIAWNPYLQ